MLHYYFIIFYYIILHLTYILLLIYKLLKGSHGKVNLERSRLWQLDGSRKKTSEEGADSLNTSIPLRQQAFISL